MIAPLAARAGAFVGALVTMSAACGPPEQNMPCTSQIAEGDVLHVELVARYAPDGEIWDGVDYNGYGAIPSCARIDGLATGIMLDVTIQGRREDMLCTQFGFVPQWDTPRWIDGALPENLIPLSGRGPNHFASTDGTINAGGCLGLYGISLFAISGDVFAAPGTAWPYGTFVQRYFGTYEPDACAPDFVGALSPAGATYCGDMYLVRVTR